MDTIWRHLPPCLTCYVIEWSNALVWRNGVYINRISRMDPRFALLHSIPKARNFQNDIFVELTNYTFFKYLSRSDAVEFALCRHYLRHDEPGTSPPVYRKIVR